MDGPQFTDQQAPGFVCCLCLYHGPPRDEDASPLLTVINGQMVCVEHAGYVQGERFSLALGLLRKQYPPT